MGFVLAFLALVALETYVVVYWITHRPVSQRALTVPDATLLGTGFPGLDEALCQFGVDPSETTAAEVEFQTDYAQGAIESCCF